MKKYIQYEVLPIDEHSPFSEFFAVIRWFDGEQVMFMESPTLNNFTEGWRWIAEKLKEFEKVDKNKII